MQKIDLGIALCHFALAAGEKGLDVTFTIHVTEMIVRSVGVVSAGDVGDSSALAPGLSHDFLQHGLVRFLAPVNALAV